MPISLGSVDTLDFTDTTSLTTSKSKMRFMCACASNTADTADTLVGNTLGGSGTVSTYGNGLRYINKWRRIIDSENGVTLTDTSCTVMQFSPTQSTTNTTGTTADAGALGDQTPFAVFTCRRSGLYDISFNNTVILGGGTLFYSKLWRISGGTQTLLGAAVIVQDSSGHSSGTIRVLAELTAADTLCCSIQTTNGFGVRSANPAVADTSAVPEGLMSLVVMSVD